MGGIGKSLLGSAAAIALVSGAMMLTTSEASAQFNIEGIIRGAVGHGYYGGSHRGHRVRTHESRRERERDRDADRDKDKDKDKDAKDQGTPNRDAQADSKPARRQFSNSTHPTPESTTSDPPAQQQPAPQPSKSNDDEPAFSPSR